MIRINPYEIMLLIEPDVPEERHREVIERVQQIVEKGKGSWGGVEPWGRRKLAYEIKHMGEAWYYVLTFDAPAPVLHEATRVLAITDGVMRFMADQPHSRQLTGQAGRPCRALPRSPRPSQSRSRPAPDAVRNAAYHTRTHVRSERHRRNTWQTSTESS